VLEGREAKDAIRMLNAFKVGDVMMGVSETGRRSWEVDDLVYALYPDGTLTVGKAGVPEAEEERQYLHENARANLSQYEASISTAEERMSSLLQGSQDVVA
jgi:hypothetical protein